MSQIENRYKPKILVLPEDVDDPNGWGEAWALVSCGADEDDEVHRAKAKQLWWACYRRATRDSAEFAGYNVVETGKIGSAEHLEAQQQILADKSLELVAPSVLDMGSVFADAKWRFNFAWSTYATVRVMNEKRMSEEDENGDAD